MATPAELRKQRAARERKSAELRQRAGQSTTTTTIKKYRETANQGAAWKGKKAWGR